MSSARHAAVLFYANQVDEEYRPRTAPIDLGSTMTRCPSTRYDHSGIADEIGFHMAMPMGPIHRYRFENAHAEPAKSFGAGIESAIRNARNWLFRRLT